MSLCSAPCGFLEKKGGYAHGFCSCFRSPVVCIATFFCPCIVVGRIAGEMDGRDFSCIPCLCGVLGEYRLRRDNQASFATAETHDSSMIASTCCHCCAYVFGCGGEWMANTQGDPGRAPVERAQDGCAGCGGDCAGGCGRAGGCARRGCCVADVAGEGLCDVCEDVRLEAVRRCTLHLNTERCALRACYVLAVP